MSEKKLYLNPHVHTGQIREATFDLARRGVEVVDASVDRLQTMLTDLGPITSPVIIGRVLSSHSLPPKIRRRWNHDEVALQKLLVLGKIISAPVEVDETPIPLMQREGQKLGDVIPKEEIKDVMLGFWRQNAQVFSEVLIKVEKEPEAVPLAKQTLAQSHVLRYALNAGIYLT